MLRLALCLCFAGLAACASQHDPTASTLPADGERWFRGNTHTHTLWSDGNAAPELVASFYVEHGYDFLVLSEHNILPEGERWMAVDPAGRLTPGHVADLREAFGEVDIREREGVQQMRLRTLDELRERFETPGEFLFIPGEEITDVFERHPVHVNGINLERLIEPQGGDSLRATLNRNVDAVAAQSEHTGRPMLAHVNHPNFGWGLSWEDVAHVVNDRFFEVYNGHSGVRNEGDAAHPGMEEMWDLANTLRLLELNLPLLYGVATDDSHDYHGWGVGHTNPGRGWVMVATSELQADGVVAAMRMGRFHASSGVSLSRVETGGGRYLVTHEVESGVEYTTHFIGTRSVEGGDPLIGSLLLETRSNPAIYEFTGDELFVRAVVVSSKKHRNPYKAGDMEMAWTQPVRGDG
jgi:hypothetical protein